MTGPNASTRWGSTIVAALAGAGIDLAVVTPGSRSTPLALAAARRDDVDTISLLDERSAGFFAVGRAKATGEPVVVITTSGTAAANLHPAVMEADRSRTPLVLCTADRPAELHGSGANQTVDQSDLYGRAVRFAPAIPEAGPGERRQRSLATTVALGVARSTDPVPGPVHLNVPFSKPLAPEPKDLADFPMDSVDAIVTVEGGSHSPAERSVAPLVEAIDHADRGIIVAGPADPRTPLDPLLALADQTGFPLVADALSGLRFGTDRSKVTPIGGHDTYLDTLPSPDLVIRAGHRPTSRTVQQYLGNHEGRHVLVDPAGEYRDPEFSTTDVITADPGPLVSAVLGALDADRSATDWNQRLHRVEDQYWSTVDRRDESLPAEGLVASETIAFAPAGSTVFVSNSMPIRDVERFGRPRDDPLTVLGNRGASGIDGIVSTGLGAADDHAIVFTGDLALYHDMNGLLGIGRAGVDATVVVINNDGGGIFHTLPIAEIDPPFTDLFETPHGLDFEQAADLFGLDYVRTEPAEFTSRYVDALGGGSTVIDVVVDGERNHRRRATFADRIRQTVRDR